MSGGVLYLALILGIFYFFIIRPQSKKQKERDKMLNEVAKGDNVVTVGGVHGKVEGFKNETTVLLKVADNVKLTVDKTAISLVKGKDKGNDKSE